MELGPVGEHQRERLAAPEAELGEAAGERVHALAQLAPGDREGVSLGADRDLVGALGRGDAKRLCERRRFGGDRRGSPARHGLC